jgi:putative ABC transport system permease protein
MRAVLARFRSFWRALRGADRVAREMEAEMRFHVELEAERLMREEGLRAGEARRRALLQFGSRDRYQEEGRDARGVSGISGLSLDVKLGARMLARYPGVSMVGFLALTIGISLGAAYLEIANDFLHPRLPLAEGDRIVGVQNWDVQENDPEPRSLHDFVAWREQLRSVVQLSAFRSIERNLGEVNRPAEPAYGAEMSASAFPLARVAALQGRTLVPSDEDVGAPPVVVLGYDLWRTRFDGDPRIIGRTVQLGETPAIVVGVMPEGFAFPVRHEFWMPLRPNVLAHARREGPAIQIFGRLATGVSLGEARAELSALGRRAASAFPETHEHLRPRVVKYTQLFVGEGSTQAYLVELLFVLLLLVLSSNVATMMFARTATRENEIAMRFALGASRRRILAQFFVEALVIGSVAGVAGLVLVAWATKYVTRLLWDITQGQVPFWLDSNVNVSTILYAALLVLAGSFVAGVLPALKATGSRLQNRLRQPGAAIASGLRFGGFWSAVIVVQVMFAVLVLPPAIVAIESLTQPSQTDPGFGAEEFLSARIEMELPADFAQQENVLARFDATREELQRRLAACPEFSRVTFATRLPGMDHPQVYMQAEGEADTPGAAQDIVMVAAVDPNFFDAFDAQLIAGRGFTSADSASAARVVVVNQHFVNDILHGRNAIGRRIRYATRDPGPWYEIVGVVSNLGMDTGRDAFFPGWGPGVYYPLRSTALNAGTRLSVRIAFHVRGDAASFAQELRAIAHSVNPALRLYDVLPLDGPVDSTNQQQRMIARFAAAATALLGAIALLISLAGIYSVMSFTVARQTREIGIRVALGADRRRIITGVFSRALSQIAIGVVAGTLIWAYAIVYELDGGNRLGLLVTSAAVLGLVGLVACGVPVRRALQIAPAAALKETG